MAQGECKQKIKPFNCRATLCHIHYFCVAEIAMNDSLFFTLVQNPYFRIFLKVLIFTTMFTMGLRLSQTALDLLRSRSGHLLRSTIAVVVLVPLAGLLLGLLLKSVGLSAAAGTGLVLLAASPGAPMLTKRTGKAGGDFEFSISLQLLSSALAIVVTPIMLELFAQLFPQTRAVIHPWAIAKLLATVQLLPLGLGLGMRLVWPDIADAIAPRILKIADVLFLVFALLALVVSLPLILKSGMLPIVAVVLFAAISLLIGHLAGGAELPYQSATAVGGVARNVGLAFLIAALNKSLLTVLPTIISYVVLGSVVAIPYSIWMKKRIAQSTEEQSESSIS